MYTEIAPKKIDQLAIEQRTDYGIVVYIIVQVGIGHEAVLSSDFGKRHAAIIRWVSSELDSSRVQIGLGTYTLQVCR